MLNALGLPNPGIDHFSDVISRTRAAGVFTVGSIFGGDENEFSHLAGKMASYGVEAVELNLSCPHVEGFGSELGSSEKMVHSVVSAVRGAVSIPVWAKMTPNVADMGSIAVAAEEAGADAIVAINTVRAMAVSARLRRPVLSNVYGGLSGEALKYVGLRAVYEISRKCSIPVIGVGGVRTGEDVAEYLMAGACAVQIGTAVAERGPGLFGDVASELSVFMESEGYSSLREMIGIARR
jgi:dihydroorotate dehydrogenase (NAD+) catalytic subunit